MNQEHLTAPKSIWVTFTTNRYLSLALVLFALMLALGEIRELVLERGRHLEKAKASIAEGIAGQQIIQGPILELSCTEKWPRKIVESSKTVTSLEERTTNIFVLPQTLNIDGQASVDARHRGIYKVNAYALTSNWQMTWTKLSEHHPKATEKEGRVHCLPHSVSFNVSDARGLRSVHLTQAQEQLTIHTASRANQHSPGFHGLFNKGMVASETITLNLSLVLSGTDALWFMPIADQNDINLSSAWPDPSFQGRFLPSKREVNEHGFKANWSISSLASTAQSSVKQVLNGQNKNQKMDTDEKLGLSFHDGINVIVLSERTSKYGVLFVVLTFTFIFVFELLKRFKVHPVQYLLCGSAVALFFLMVLSLAEHIGYGLAYLASASATVLLLTYYAKYMLKGWGRALPFALWLTSLYALLYVILHLQDAALLIGTLTVFVALSLVMILTRHVDWYHARTKAG